MNRLKEKYGDDKEFITNVTQCNIRYDTIVSTGVTGFFKDKQYYSTFKDVLQENDGQSYLQMLKNTNELTFPPPVFVVLPKFDYPHSGEGAATNGDDKNSSSDSRSTNGGDPSNGYGIASSAPDYSQSRQSTNSFTNYTSNPYGMA